MLLSVAQKSEGRLISRERWQLFYVRPVAELFLPSSFRTSHFGLSFCLCRLNINTKDFSARPQCRVIEVSFKAALFLAMNIMARTHCSNLCIRLTRRCCLQGMCFIRKSRNTKSKRARQRGKIKLGRGEYSRNQEVTQNKKNSHTSGTHIGSYKACQPDTMPAIWRSINELMRYRW